MNSKNKAALLLQETGIEVKVLSLGQAKDPDEFLQKYGKEKLENQMVKSKGYIDSKLDAIYEKYNIDDPEDKIKALNELVSEVSFIKSGISREVYGTEIAYKFKMSQDNILKEIEKQASKHQKKEKTDMINNEMRKIEGYGDRINPDRVKYPESVKKEEVILGILMKNPEFYNDVKNILTEDSFISEFNRKIYGLFKSAKEEHESFDTVMITKDLSQEETSRITGMMVLAGIPENNVKNDLENYISALEKQNKIYEKKNTDLKGIAALEDDEFIKRIEANRKEKLEKLKKEDH